MSQLLIGAVLAGLFATAVMDGGAVLGSRAGILVKPSTALLGRWVLRLSRGRLRVATTIGQEPSEAHEAGIGLFAHYSIGAILGVLGFVLTGVSPESAPPIGGLIAFGVATSVFPWFSMFPAMGFGFFGLKAPDEAKLFRTSLIGHLDYGLALALAAALIHHFTNVKAP